MNLAARTRPKNFREILGQGLTPVVLERMTQDLTPTGLLFTGPAGTGKTTAARIFADALDADLVELDAGVTGSVAEIRNLTDSLRFGSARRVVVLDEAHSISKEGFNALLKTLEEPTPGVTFILVTTEPRKIPATIKTRVIEFEFQRISPDVIFTRLEEIAAETGGFPASEKLLRVIADRARGSMRQAITLLDRCIYAEVTEAEQFLTLEGVVDAGPRLISAIASGDPSKTEATLRDLLRSARTPHVVAASLISTLRDVQILRAGGTLEAVGTPLEHRKALALAITPEAAFNALTVLWQFQTNLASNEDPASDLRLVCAILEKHLNVGREILT